MTIASLRTNGVVVAVFLTIGAFAKSTGWDKVGGWAGLVTAVFAWYGSFAGVTNATWGKDDVPAGADRPPAHGRWGQRRPAVIAAIRARTLPGRGNRPPAPILGRCAA